MITHIFHTFFKIQDLLNKIFQGSDILRFIILNFPYFLLIIFLFFTLEFSFLYINSSF